MQNRFERRSYLSTSLQRFQKMCDVSIARKTLPISMFMCRPLFSTKSDYKINESSNIYLEETEYNPNSILRQDLSHSTVSKVSGSGKGHIVAESTVFVKHGKICPPTQSEKPVFRSGYLLKRIGSVSFRMKSNENSRKMFLLVSIEFQ